MPAERVVEVQEQVLADGTVELKLTEGEVRTGGRGGQGDGL
ncbi:MAG: hypothetical protein R2864_02935 [Syntrophotaleaceae bacterium]